MIDWKEMKVRKKKESKSKPVSTVARFQLDVEMKMYFVFLKAHVMTPNRWKHR